MAELDWDLRLEPVEVMGLLESAAAAVGLESRIGNKRFLLVA